MTTTELAPNQLIVTLSDISMMSNIKKAISLLKGVETVKSPKIQALTPQQNYVSQTLSTAIQEVREAQKNNYKLQSADDFLHEFFTD